MNAHSFNQVLVVEHDATIRNFLLRQLESYDYRPTGVSSIAETVAQTNLADFKAILLDWTLPDGTADDLLPKIQSLAPEASNIVVTGEADINASIAALGHGAVDYLVKPINPHCLQACMARIEQLRESKRRFALCERLATIGQAVTSVAHESRNALQRIQARIELMELDLADDKEKLEDLQVIKAASQSLRCMFEELRQFAAPVTLRKERCYLRELIKRAWQSLEALPEAKFASLEYDEDDVELTVDPMRFEQVLRNLIENSLAACRSNARIEISWSIAKLSERQMLRIHIRDNGPGFTQEQKEKAFEPFFTTKSKGTGLGLPICNRILEQHQGWLEIESDSASGGCIVLTLPFEPEMSRAAKTSQSVCEVA